MKNFTSKRIRGNCIMFIILTIGMLFPSIACGQEWVKSLNDYNMKYAYTLVRELDANSLLFSHDNDCDDSGLCIIEKDSAWAKNIFFFHYDGDIFKPHPLRIMDMKVNNDTVFLCGFWSSFSNSIPCEGFVGFFPLQGFPNCQVTLFSLGYFTRPFRMDVYTDYHGYTHLLPIWYTTYNNQYHLADFSPQGPNCYQMQMLNNGEQIPSFDIIDDIVVLQDYVVFSARSSTTHDVSLHYFNFLSNNYKIRPLYHYNKSLRITKSHTRSDLAKGLNNEFVFSYLVDTNVDHISRVTPIPYQKYSNILFFDSFMLEKTIIVGMDAESDSIGDMVYDPLNHACDMLLCCKGNCNKYKIVHVNRTPGLTIPFHRYGDYFSGDYKTYKIFSLDYLKYHPGQIVASLLLNYNQVIVAQYGYNNWSHCGETGDMIYRLYEYTPMVYSINPFVLTTDCHGVVQGYQVEPIPLHNVCEEHLQ